MQDRTAPLPSLQPEPAIAFDKQDTEPIGMLRRRRRMAVRPTYGLIALVAVVVGAMVVAAWQRPLSSASEADAGGTISGGPDRGQMGDRDGIDRRLGTPPVSPTAVLPSPPSRATVAAIPSETATVSTPTPTAMIEPTVADPPPAATATMFAPHSPSPVVSRAEVIVNGGFEAGDRGWSLDAGAGTAALNAHNGHHALILASAGGAGRQIVEVEPGGVYRLSAWCFVGAVGDRAQIAVAFPGPNGKWIEGSDPAPLHFVSSHYVRRTVTFTVPSDVTSIAIVVRKPAGPGIVAIDDVSLRVVSTSSERE